MSGLPQRLLVSSLLGLSTNRTTTAINIVEGHPLYVVQQRQQKYYDARCMFMHQRSRHISVHRPPSYQPDCWSTRPTDHHLRYLIQSINLILLSSPHTPKAASIDLSGQLRECSLPAYNISTIMLVLLSVNLMSLFAQTFPYFLSVTVI